jgi:hypothetical protein
MLRISLVYLGYSKRIDQLIVDLHAVELLDSMLHRSAAKASTISSFEFDYDMVANVDDFSKLVPSNEPVSVDRDEVNHREVQGVLCEGFVDHFEERTECPTKAPSLPIAAAIP